MNVLLFGATGMVGQGVLRECLLDSGVASVVSIGRSATGVSDPSCAKSFTPISRITRPSSLSYPASMHASSVWAFLPPA